MPVRKKDAQRALSLLEEYRTKLNHTEDWQLRLSIQRVIDIFQSNLFQALIVILITPVNNCLFPMSRWSLIQSQSALCL
ncbi:unnamed protein product [Coregonus sp. 'balchen']|nr:unnamed protein product [Coregonus sp. 'balchen']